MKSIDPLINSLDLALRTLAGVAHAGRPYPGSGLTDDDGPHTAEERQLSGALMRVNHVGEVCTQALYQAQGLTARTPEIRAQMARAAREETDHMAWTQRRLDELGARPSLLNPLWFLGSFGIGLLAGRLGEAVSLGFVVETERQVEAHLADHMQLLPASDLRSRAVVAQMKSDEAHHAEVAQAAGAQALPAPARWLMRAAAKVMTTTAQRI